MKNFYVTKGDVIRVYFNEEFFTYIRRVFAWEQDRFSAYQATLDHDLNPLYINDWTGSLWTSLYNRVGIDFARENDHHESMNQRHIDFLVNGTREDGTFILQPVGNIFSIKTEHYLQGYRLTIEDVNKKFFIMGAALGPRPTKKEHNDKIFAQIKELESKLVN